MEQSNEASLAFLNVKLGCIIFFLLWMLPPVNAEAPPSGWERGVQGGRLVAGSASPDGKLALFEINMYDGDLPTTATAIVVADTQHTILFGFIHSFTQHETDLPHKKFLTVSWSPDSQYLATHDSTAKHSVLCLYQIASGTCRSLKTPDLRRAAADQLHVDDARLTGSGQIPLKWLQPDKLLVRVKLSAPKATRQVELVVSIQPDGSTDVQSAPGQLR